MQKDNGKKCAKLQSSVGRFEIETDRAKERGNCDGGGDGGNSIWHKINIPTSKSFHVEWTRIIQILYLCIKRISQAISVG